MIPLRLIAIAFGLTLAASAQAADPAGAPAALPAQPDTICAGPGVLSAIVSRFNWAEQNTFKRGFGLGALANPRPNLDPVLNVGVIPKRYCIADATMTNGRRTTAYYVVSLGQGFASIGSGLDFCVLGFDPWRVHDWQCRTVR